MNKSVVDENNDFIINSDDYEEFDIDNYYTAGKVKYAEIYLEDTNESVGVFDQYSLSTGDCILSDEEFRVISMKILEVYAENCKDKNFSLRIQEGGSVDTVESIEE